jgi:predicted DNA-binding transcriptional regulator YafY
MRVMETSLRYLKMLQLLPRQPLLMSAPDLQKALADAGYPVDLRSVQRDLHRLSAIVPLVCLDGKPPGWAWARSAPPFAWGGMDAVAALALVLAGTAYGAVLPASIRRALEPTVAAARKALDAHGDGGIGGFARRFRVVAQAPPTRARDVEAAVLEGVTRALTERRVIAARVRASGRKLRDVRLSPLGLVLRGTTLHLVARTPDDRAPRTLPLHRVRAAEVLDEAADVADFDLDTFLGSSAAPPLEAVALVARFRGRAAVAVEETPLAADQRVEVLGDGAVRVRATVADDAALRAWLLGLGDEAVVEGPPPLVEAMAAKIRAMAALYAGR